MLCSSLIKIWNLANHMITKQKYQNTNPIGEKLKIIGLMFFVSFFSCDLQDFDVSRKAFGASFLYWVDFITSWEEQGEHKLGMMNIINCCVSVGTESILPWVQKHCLWLLESIEHVPCPQTAKLLWPSQTSCFSVQWTPNQLFRQWQLYKKNNNKFHL